MIAYLYYNCVIGIMENLQKKFPSFQYPSFLEKFYMAKYYNSQYFIS